MESRGIAAKKNILVSEREDKVLQNSCSFQAVSTVHTVHFWLFYFHFDLRME
jgi:hypothetical protein